MILDRLEVARRQYPWLPPPFLQAFEFLLSERVGQLPGGKHVIDGDRLFAIVQSYEPKSINECRLEAHRRYWDVQYVARGEEQMGWAPLANVEVTEPHDSERDVGFFRGTYQLFSVPAGTFVIFGPGDVHMPGISPADARATLVRKVVVKVESP
jgi:biofilm protein TabA